MALYSYVLRFDTGDAPNPYGGMCTLAVCKPAIRRTARVGDWIIGTGSQRLGIAGYLVYAMRVSETMSLAKYDMYCQEKLPLKIPGHRLHMHKRENVAGDSLYDYSDPQNPIHRGGIVHTETWLQERDQRGKNVLLSDHFYYFGSEPRLLPAHLQALVKRNQGHYKRTGATEIAAFEEWLTQKGFKRNKVYADPQMPIWEQVEQFQEVKGSVCGGCS